MSESEFAVPVSEQLPVLLAGFAVHLDSRELAARTRTGYLDRATQYLRWLAADDDHPEALADPDARDAAVVAWLSGADLAPRSVRTSLAALAMFHDWLGLGAPDAPRVTAELYTPPTLDHGEHRALLAAAAAAGPREYAMVVLTLDVGARAHELAALDVDDLDLTGWPGRLTITPASGQSRTVAISAASRAALTAWLSHRHLRLLGRAHPTRALFVSRVGGRMGLRSVDRVIRAVGAGAGLLLAPGTLRATAERRMLAGGVDPATVAARLGRARTQLDRAAVLLGQRPRRTRAGLTDSEQLTLFGDITA